MNSKSSLFISTEAPPRAAAPRESAAEQKGIMARVAELERRVAELEALLANLRQAMPANGSVIV